jgi:CDP-6-deoxy-D-xylo-4-hexulose-3-dehydrase
MKNFKHSLMENNFTKSDIDQVIKLLKKKNVILTQSTNVLKFEKAWSKWLGVKYSTFVNSGSSANLLSISILKILDKKNKQNVILPALTWSSDVASVIQNNLKPLFVDINLNNLSMNLEDAKKKN